MGFRPPQILPINSFENWESAPDPKDWYLDYATSPIWVAGKKTYSNGYRWVNNELINGLSSLSILGDSINKYGNQGINLATAVSSGQFSNSHIAWCSELMAINSGVGFDAIGFYALGGTTLQDCIITQLPLALADGTSGSWVHTGINNNVTSANALTISQQLAYHAKIIAALAAVKDYVIYDSLNPVLQSGSTSAKARAHEIPAINAGIAAICSQYNNVIYNDTYSAMIDTTSAVLNPLSNMVRTDDGIHFVSAGARAAGYQSFKNIVGRLALTRYKTPGTNLLPAFSGTDGTTSAGTGSITGTPPVDWDVTVASGSAAVTISSVSPDKIRLAITNAGGAASTVQLKLGTTFLAALASQFAVGDIVQASIGYACTGNTLLNRIACSIRYSASGISQATVNGFGQDSTNEPTITYPQTASSGIRSTPPITLPKVPSASGMEFIAAINVGASTGAATVDFFNPQLVKLI